MELQQSLEGERVMGSSILLPVQVAPALALGQTVVYKGISITINDDGKLTIDGVTDAVCVAFNRNGGMNCSWRGFAVLRGLEISIFEGPSIGFGMLTREMALAACKP